jgi:thioredoxin-dependent peroxiredoxin
LIQEDNETDTNNKNLEFLNSNCKHNQINYIKMTTLKKGDKAPDFSGFDQDNKLHQLADYKGKKLVVFFYPKANTPGCTAEACDLRDNYERFVKNNYALLGVSADSQKAQGKFKDKFQFQYPLLADEDKLVIQAFGVWGPKKFMGKEYDGIHRTTFIINENGIIDEVIADVKTKEHAAQILR